MDPTLQFILAMAIIVAVAKGAGYLSSLLKQPPILGELLAGLLLGPSLLDMLHWPIFSDPHLGDTISEVAHVGVLILMFIAGLETDFETMVRVGKPATYAGVFGVIAPAALGAAVALLFGFHLQNALFMGLVLAATSVSISAQTLMELGVLRSKVSCALLSAAVVDDVIVILLLSLFFALVGGGGGGLLATLLILLRVIGFLGLAGLLGIWLIPRLVTLVERLPISEGVMASTLIIVLLYSWGAEVLGGLAAITGAFLAGLIFGRTSARHHIASGMHTLAYAWLVPIFLVSIGLEANARELSLADIPFALLIVVVAVVSKIIGCGLGAFLAGFTPGECLRLGVGMASRGEVGLIVASIGLRDGLIKESIFAIVVLMVLATTLLTPIMLRLLYPQPKQQPIAECEVEV